MRGDRARECAGRQGRAENTESELLAWTLRRPECWRECRPASIPAPGGSDGKSGKCLPGRWHDDAKLPRAWSPARARAALRATRFAKFVSDQSILRFISETLHKMHKFSPESLFWIFWGQSPFTPQNEEPAGVSSGGLFLFPNPVSYPI